MIQYVRTDFINGRPDGCQTFCLCLIQWRFNASKASDCVWCARGRFAILQISITNYTPLYIFAFLFKIKQTSLHHNKNLQGVFFTCPSLKVRSMELVPPNEEPSLRWSPPPHLLWQKVISSSSLGLYIEPEKNILWVAWTLRCFQYIFIRWISLLQALPFSMCWAEPVNFFIGWVQFHT